MDNNLPPLPEGAKLDTLPPLPEGATLDTLPPLPEGATLDSDSPPRLPNMQPIHDVVQGNLSGQEQTDQQQTPQQRTDAGLGTPVKDLLRPDAAMPSNLVPHVTQAFKDGTATTNSDYLQTALPMAAVSANPEEAGGYFNQKILALRQGFAESAAAAVADAFPTLAKMSNRYLGTNVPTNDMDKFVAAVRDITKTDFPELPHTTGNEVAKAIGGMAPALMAPEAAIPFFALQGLGQADLDNKDSNAPQGMKDINTLSKGAINTLTAFIPGFKEIPEEARAGVMGFAVRTLKQAGVGAALFPAIGAVNDAIDKYTTSPDKVIGLGAVHQGEVGLLVGALTHGLVVEPTIAAGRELLKPQVSEMVGKTPENTTAEDVVGVINNSHKNEPSAHDFEATAAAIDDHATMEDEQNKSVVTSVGEPAPQAIPESSPAHDDGEIPDGWTKDDEDNYQFDRRYVGRDLEAEREDLEMEMNEFRSSPEYDAILRVLGFDPLKERLDANNRADLKSKLSSSFFEAADKLKKTVDDPDERNEKFQELRKLYMDLQKKINFGELSQESGVADNKAANARELAQQNRDQANSINPSTQGEDFNNPHMTSIDITPEPKLPKDLAGAKTNYSYQKKRFQVSFDSDIDRAMYITAQKDPSPRDADYRKFLTDQGYTDAEIAQHGAAIRDHIKGIAKDSDPGKIKMERTSPRPTSRSVGEEGSQENESGEAHGISVSDIGELENVHAALSRRDAQLQDSAAKISSSLGDLNNLLSEMPRGAVSDQVQAALDQVKEMGNSLGSNDNFNEEKLANTFHDLSDRLGFIRQNITDTNVNKAASAIIDKISDIFLDREMSGGFLARDVADINRKFPGAGTDAKSLQDRIDKESRAWEERNRSRNEAIANKRANDLVNMAIEKQNTEDPNAPTTEQQQSTINTLRKIRSETGVRPDQVFVDYKVDPAVAEDIRNGQIPDKYLREKSNSEEGYENEFRGDEGDASDKVGTNKRFSIKDYAKNLAKKLHQKLGQDQESDIASIKREKETKKIISKDLDKKFYQKRENPNLKLTAEEQELYDKHIEPRKQEERDLYEKAASLGAKDIEPVSDDYVHRIAKGKGHYLDKYDSQFGNDDDFGFGIKRGISQTTSSLKDTQFHVVEDSQGNRQFKSEEIPKGMKTGDKFKDAKGKEWTIKRATTEEIEKNTDVRYHKSAITNTEDNIRKLQKTIRNIEFLNGLKEDMGKTHFGVPPTEETHPAGFQQVSVPELRGWSFDPRIAEVINDVYDRGGPSMLGMVNNLLIKGMYLWPVPHIENVLYDYIASRGWQNVRGIKGVNYISKGVQDVKEFSPLYREVLKLGGALKMPSVWKVDFYNGLLRQSLKEIQSSKEGLDLAKSWGFDSVPAMAENVFNQSQKALWGSGDAFLMAKIRELKDGGMSTEDAIDEAQKHIIDYRVPTRVGENVLGPDLSRLLSKSLQGNAIFVFTRYHYGLFKSLGNSVKDLAMGAVNRDPSLALKAAGQLFATYFMLSVVDPAIAKAFSYLTGQDEKMKDPGVTGLMGAIKDVATGQKSIGQAASSQLITSPGLQLISDFLRNKIVDTSEGHEGIQIMDYLMKQPSMSVPSIAYNIKEGKSTKEDEVLKQIGITVKKEEKVRKPSKSKIEKLESEESNLLD